MTDLIDLIEPKDLPGYTVGKQLGSGEYGSVYSGIQNSSHTPVAIKIIPQDIVRTPAVIDGKTISLEVHLMQKVKHIPGCIQIMDYFENKNCLIIIMERFNNAIDLFDYLENKKDSKLAEREAAHLFKQVVKAVEEVHIAGVMHGDIKDQNILVDPTTRTIKLIDFGSGFLLTSGIQDDFLGTPAWTPPEIYASEIYQALPHTVWTLGILLYVMVCGDVPCATLEGIQMGTCESEYTQLSANLQDLLCQMLSKNPTDRPDFHQIVHHPWMTSIAEEPANCTIL